MLYPLTPSDPLDYRLGPRPVAYTPPPAPKPEPGWIDDYRTMESDRWDARHLRRGTTAIDAAIDAAMMAEIRELHAALRRPNVGATVAALAGTGLQVGDRVSLRGNGPARGTIRELRGQTAMVQYDAGPGSVEPIPQPVSHLCLVAALAGTGLKVGDQVRVRGMDARDRRARGTIRELRGQSAIVQFDAGLGSMPVSYLCLVAAPAGTGLKVGDRLRDMRELRDRLKAEVLAGSPG